VLLVVATTVQLLLVDANPQSQWPRQQQMPRRSLTPYRLRSRSGEVVDVANAGNEAAQNRPVYKYKNNSPERYDRQKEVEADAAIEMQAKIHDRRKEAEAEAKAHEIQKLPPRQKQTAPPMKKERPKEKEEMPPPPPPPPPLSAEEKEAEKATPLKGIQRESSPSRSTPDEPSDRSDRGNGKIRMRLRKKQPPKKKPDVAEDRFIFSLFGGGRTRQRRPPPPHYRSRPKPPQHYGPPPKKPMYKKRPTYRRPPKKVRK
jgi:hypothetical protein